MAGQDAPLRVGLLGAGGIAAAHLDAWQALGAECILFSRTRPEALAARFGVEIADDADGLIDRVDVVGILAPTPTHPEFARRAIAQGRHVVCEKPLAVSAADARRMTDAAEAAGVRLFPAHVVRYFAAYRRIQQQLAAGGIGALRSLRLSRSGAGPSSTWFYDEHAGGGLIRDLLVHDIDQALWLAGPAVSVSARQDPPSVDGRLAAPVTATVELTHANGVTTRIDGGWLGEEAPFRTTIEAVGTGGTLAHDSAAAAAADAGTGASRSGEAGYLPPQTDDHPYRAQIADFADALRTGLPARVTPADGVAAVAVVEAAYASIAAGGAAVPA
ncbi:Gfo/Idh/MocA family protein [Microbacterium azadirachtae]|uniref:Gfo/Idh/MocA family protein n=1 Tax=Microbacterium azadirachtae TaxID=582680 RepID=UPI000882D36F|nr:Gfo/Idh/MocA family oxidoreductase [Microbacterium azadirachtae]SDL62463.1 Predicted dehydrogenase [Microbacterium azadirachtae]SEF91326.1 Predicted dehydrogenase [Microbacterium azadirachtae]SEF93363.1 Predicted dehydrogenase [Microbacterium azadirachtae]